MATYNELFSIANDHTMKNKVAVAAMVKADAISELATPTTLQLDWAKSACTNPISVAQELWYSMIGANSDTAIGLITGASDAVIQTAVNNAVDNIFTKAGA